MGMLNIRFTPKSTILPAHKLKLMELLRFSSADLTEHLQAQSDANPLLDIESRPICPRCGRAFERNGCKQCRLADTSFRQHSPARKTYQDEEQPDYAELIQQPRSSLSSLMEQCGELPLTDEQRDIAEYLLGELDDRGFLVGTVTEHATYLKIQPEIVEMVRRHLLQLDPVGIAATSVRECLSVKIKTHASDKPWAKTALKLLESEWETIAGEGQMDFARAARALKLSQNQLLDVLGALKDLCPYPLQGLRDDERDTLPAVPDVRFEVAGTNDTAYAMIDILEQERTAIYINPDYPKSAESDVQTYLAEHRREARFLQKAVELRWKTMERVCLAIFEAQRHYFTDGHFCPTTLIPLTREAIAGQLGMHPSTIGRAIEEKYAALPNGRVVPLRYFFDQNVPIRALLRRRITAEERPMSDGDLCDYLARRGWSMSRRAAAYHREAANILPKKLRSRERLLHRHRPAS